MVSKLEAEDSSPIDQTNNNMTTGAREAYPRFSGQGSDKDRWGSGGGLYQQSSGAFTRSLSRSIGNRPRWQYLALGLGCLVIILVWALQDMQASLRTALQNVAAKGDEDFGQGPEVTHNAKTIVLVSDAQAKEALRVLGALLTPDPPSPEIDLKRCPLINVGTDWGMHVLCGEKLMHKDPTGQCLVISYGISIDYSFDVQIQGLTGCKVVAMDPSISHPERLAPSVRFFQWAAPGVFVDPSWTVMPLTGVARKLRMTQMRTPIVKMDCEGCEYMIFEDVKANDPLFFTRVDQVALEVHVSRKWMISDDAVLSYGRLLELLSRSGLRLMHGSISGCHPDDEVQGCPEMLVETGYPCGPSKMCQNLLFARA